MKGYIRLFTVAIISSLLTAGGMYYIAQSRFDNDLSLQETPKKPILPPTHSVPKAVAFVHPNEGDQMGFVSAAKKTVDAVVHVENYSSEPMESGNPLFDLLYGMSNRSSKPQKVSSGSGVIITEDGYIVTNNHVIQGASQVKVTLNDQKTYAARLIGTDPNTDIALLKVEAKGLPFLTLSNSDDVRVGEWVLAVGNPFNLSSTVTAGIVSAKGRSINILKRNGAEYPIESFIQTDAVVNAGNSGGALVNCRGDLIGINSAISTHTGFYEGYSFAIPANLVSKVVKDMLEYGSVKRAFLGITPMDLTLASIRYHNSENPRNTIQVKPQDGVYIAGLTDGGAARESGLRVGDIIKKLNGKKIENSAALVGYIGSKRPGTTVRVTVNRSGKTKTYNVKLRDIIGKTTMLSDTDLGIKTIAGAKLKALDAQTKRRYGLPAGILVLEVGPGIMAEAGITAGEVITYINGIPVNATEDVKKIIDKRPHQIVFKTYDLNRHR
ncbi:MAG: trypsin-like peptidase domain-containing protein [Flavobacteriales bacterium]